MITTFPNVWQEKLQHLAFKELTPIQKEMFTPILNKENVLGISPTGTGKTLAYLLPSLLNIKSQKSQQLLILAPNTELAGQIFEVTKEWAEPINLTAQLLISGISQKRQIERLKKRSTNYYRNPWESLRVNSTQKSKNDVSRYHYFR